MINLSTAFLPQLLAWSAAWSIAATIGLWTTRTRAFWKSFWFMNALWVVVNTSVAIWAMLDPPAGVEEFRKLLLINSALDLAYIAIGLAIATRKKPMLRGFGAAIIIQGAALLIFDLAWWSALA